MGAGPVGMDPGPTFVEVPGWVGPVGMVPDLGASTPSLPVGTAAALAGAADALCGVAAACLAAPATPIRGLGCAGAAAGADGASLEPPASGTVLRSDREAARAR